MSTGQEDNRTGVEMRGIGVSPGVVVGPVMLVMPQAVEVPSREIGPTEFAGEVARLEEALIATRGQLKRIQSDLLSKTGLGDASILDAHLMVLDDRAFIEEVITRIRDARLNVEAAISAVADKYVSVLASMEDDYLRERVADVRDVVRRILRNLAGQQEVPVAPEGGHKYIVIAPDLAPSDTAGLRRDVVCGFATDMGSPTSHTALMARALEIPAVVAMRDVCRRVRTGDTVLIDGNKGVLLINPTPEQLEQYGEVAEARRTIEQELTALQHKPAETTDGHRIVLSANIEHQDEVDAVIEHGAEGIGLFRSEYLYIFRGKPVDEEEQTEVYTKVASRLAPQPVIIRTLDLGGDKFYASVPSRPEANPFLGCRSIRLSLQYPEHFKSQLRAILRASAGGNVRIMYPMIANLREVEQANALLGEAKAELEKAGVPFAREVEVGAMIEVPAAALIADALAQRVRFFSLGTNDLIQYTIAVDRVNERVAYLYEPTHPAVLRLIKMTIDAGHRHGIWVGLCGEMAADPVMTPLLLGLGVDELSVTPALVPLVKDAVRSVSFAQAQALAEAALTCSTPTEVLRHCRELVREVAPELLELVWDGNG